MYEASWNAYGTVHFISKLVDRANQVLKIRFLPQNYRQFKDQKKVSLKSEYSTYISRTDDKLFYLRWVDILNVIFI